MSRLPVTVVTGFLGAGKTTLVRRMLAGSDPSATVVIVNEFAELGVDDVLLGDSVATSIPVTGGCVCCSRRDELLAVFRSVLDDYERGRLMGLGRVVVETSGLADPLPILTTVAEDPVLRHHFVLEEVVAVVDGLSGLEQLEAHPEVAHQVQAADRVVVSKSDLAEPAGLEELSRRLAALSGAAARVPASHTKSVTSVSLTFDAVDWVAFGVWLSLLAHAHASDLLRLKGVLPTGEQGLVSVNAVQGTVYPPDHTRGTRTKEVGRLVVIARNLGPDAISRSFLAFQAAA